jgi:hypothetical protein
MQTTGKSRITRIDEWREWDKEKNYSCYSFIRAIRDKKAVFAAQLDTGRTR